MQFLLPEMYKKAEDAPRPTDERVVIKAAGGRNYGVVMFSHMVLFIWILLGKKIMEVVEIKQPSG
ncbi:unnamed protein product [Brassica napus]|uniref:(rape) hypothetical protein n=1 Tax=Brassica napus TaxID=3708 RepID=A0A816XIS8_BRANA|nr:unnamed protein product [Brassica napus]